ncbi:MAG: DUF2520 domain-containing protein [Flavobacteriales bacterium]|nr:DUF2520 domain-containing protein [Flavobacteriales bacterium]
MLIGSGNVATQLGISLTKAGHDILQIYSRSIESAELLANQTQSGYTDNIEDINPNGNIYIISIKDDAIEKTTSLLNLKDQVIAHTAGSISKDVLSKTSSNYGVLYPLQTFNKSLNVDFKSIPICVEANNAETLRMLNAIAESLSNHVQEINFNQRKQLHLAAVFACNFTNHMYVISNDLLNKVNLPFELILPLIKETTDKLESISPEDGQTGPAARNDQKVLAKHIEALESNENLQGIYKLLSQSIQKTK